MSNKQRTSHGKHQVNVASTLQEQQAQVKQYLEAVIEQCSPNSGIIIGFSGGSMPQFIAPLFAQLPNEVIQRIHFFPVDERLVPIEHEESNSGILQRLLPADKFAGRVLQVPNELLGDGFKSAQQFERQLRNLNPPINENGFPIFDLLLLGLGPDGHTCSLFPGHRLLSEDTVWVTHLDDSPKPPPRRITVTLPVLNAARNVAFIANGASKAAVIKAIVGENDQQFPPSRIKRMEIEWFIDNEAGSQIH